MNYFFFHSSVAVSGATTRWQCLATFVSKNPQFFLVFHTKIYTNMKYIRINISRNQVLKFLSFNCNPGIQMSKLNDIFVGYSNHRNILV